MANLQTSITGCILGTAVGDALGLPFEGLSKSRAFRMLAGPIKYRFLFRRGMVSDDTEHTCMVAQSLIESGDDVARFAKSFSRRLRWWFLALPAGIGIATAKSCFKLWLGFPPEKSGVFSAGNGPAMRAAIFGAAIEDLKLMLEFVQTSSRLTHTDPKASFGAIAVALAAREARLFEIPDPARYLNSVRSALGGDGSELILLLEKVADSVGTGESTVDYCQNNGMPRGVSGYVYQTVPASIHAWLSHPRDIDSALQSIIRCGGDTDSTAAIVGGIIGSGVGQSGIPKPLLEGLIEWPRSANWMTSLAKALATSRQNGQSGIAPSINPIAVLMRNAFFLAVVSLHGFRRLLASPTRAVDSNSNK